MVTLLEVNTVNRRDVAEWLQKNPLREYRSRHNLSQTELAVLKLRVSLMTIRGWEMGAWRPGPPNMKTIGTLLGESDMDEVWDAWLNDRPEV